jgi:hypothetical protein
MDTFELSLNQNVSHCCKNDPAHVYLPEELGLFIVLDITCEIGQIVTNQGKRRKLWLQVNPTTQHTAIKTI